MTGLLLELEKDLTPDLRRGHLEAFFREAHSLKGAAQAVGFDDIEARAHELESRLSEMKTGNAALGPETLTFIYQRLDGIAAAMKTVPPDPSSQVDTSISREDTQAGVPRPAPATVPGPGQAAPPASAGGDGSRLANAAPTVMPTVRVPAAKLDSFLAEAGELLVARMGVEQPVETLGSVADLANRWHDDWRQVRGMIQKRGWPDEGGAPPAELLRFLHRNEERLRELQEQMHCLRHRFKAETRRLAQVSANLQDEVKRIRLLPISTVFNLFPRMVRDLAREKGKRVTLQVVGADTELDKTVLELLKDPLVHLVRNCLDHGIESPQDRERVGKPPEGTITLEAGSEGGSVTLAVADDGRGIDTQRVKEAALRKGIVEAEELAAMDEQAALALVLRPGLSTNAMITDLSGRGVGLDVVREHIERLHGRVEISSTLGGGTRVVLTVPVTLTTTQGLLVEAAGQTFAIPLGNVERILRVSREQMVAVAGQDAIRYNGRPVTLVGLEDILGLPPVAVAAKDPLPDDTVTAVVLASGEQRAAFRVRRLLGEQEIVIKSLGPQLAKVRHVIGAAILGTGEVVVVLNVIDLLRSAGRAQIRRHMTRPGAPAVAEERQTILVVDDSITTRTLVKTILEAAGYEVLVAIDGVEAWNVLQADGCDLVVTDVAMPGMDGFELTTRLRSDEALKRMPVILVTSLETREDKERGIAAGADAYIMKSMFDQANLLETIRQLL